MPRLEELEHDTLENEHGWTEDVRDGAYGLWDSFSNFALRDNVLEVAVGLMYVE
jgi:large conductance mechanosensitive channel